jgi:hypothetical protein
MEGYCAEDPSSCFTFPPCKTKAFINTLITSESLCVTLKVSTLVPADRVSSLGSAQHLECREPQPCEMAGLIQVDINFTVVKFGTVASL